MVAWVVGVVVPSTVTPRAVPKSSLLVFVSVVTASSPLSVLLNTIFVVTTTLPPAIFRVTSIALGNI